MSPVLRNLVNQASGIQQIGFDQVRRANAFLTSAFGAGAYGQSAPLASTSSLNPVTANSIAAAFQGFSDENFLDVLVYVTAVKIQAAGVASAVGTVPTDGFALNALVTANWGGAPGITNAQQVTALNQYGALLQAGANLAGITNPF